jgi:mRNA-degrading endonuclease RelE of RelBE toxin-antitoxin system
MPRLVWTRDAVKVLMGMQPKRAAAIRDKCRAIATEPPPSGEHSNLRRLANVPNGYRVRFGNWRVSFRIDPETDLMEVFEVAPRGGAYRW